MERTAQDIWKELQGTRKRVSGFEYAMARDAVQGFLDSVGPNTSDYIGDLTARMDAGRSCETLIEANRVASRITRLLGDMPVGSSAIHLAAMDILHAVK